MKKKTLFVTMMTIGTLVTGAVITGTLFYLRESSSEPIMTVYKSPACGCCSKWVDHVKENGYRVKVVEDKDLSMIKIVFGINKILTSCHTAIIDDYVIEGHVPAGDIKRMLAERPDIARLSVAGMPMGSPGMETGSRSDRYNVVSFDKDGNVEFFNRY